MLILYIYEFTCLCSKVTAPKLHKIAFSLDVQLYVKTLKKLRICSALRRSRALLSLRAEITPFYP